MKQAELNPPPSLWQRLVESNAVYSGAFRDFLAPEIDRVASVRHGLQSGGIDRATAIQVFPYLAAEERLDLFPDLVRLASSAHGSIGAIRQLVLSLPRNHVLAEIETEAEAYLRNGTSDEFRRFLELYWLLDRDMTGRLAHRSAASADPDIREAGEDFLEKLADNA